MFNRDRYWKCEYENLRRKKKRQIEQMTVYLNRFVKITWDLLHHLGMTDEQILEYYKRMQDEEDEDG